MSRPPWRYLLSTAVIIEFCVAAPVTAADVYKCAGADGSSSYSDSPCAADAEGIEIRANSGRTSATAGPQIQSANYSSPRNGRSFDVTNQLKSLCLHAPGSCTLSCGNQLAGDPDFGQRKYCRIVYVCVGGKAQEVRVQEAERLTLSCSADVATTVVRQNALPSLTGATVSAPTYSASNGTSRDNQSDRAAVNASTSSPVAAGSADVLELARIVQALGGNGQNDQSMAFTMFAGFQMRMIAPDDPGWNRSNPHWVALFKDVEQDLKRDLEPALQARMADGVREIAGTFGSHLTAADVRQLLAFYRSEKGQRYIAFQQRLGAIQTQGVTQLTGAIMGAGGNTAPSDAPSQKRLDARRRVLANSWMSLIVPDAMTTNQTSSTQQCRNSAT